MQSSFKKGLIDIFTMHWQGQVLWALQNLKSNKSKNLNVVCHLSANKYLHSVVAAFLIYWPHTALPED